MAWRARSTARRTSSPELLTDGSRPPAQRTLRTVLDWSVDHLPPPPRDIFARLSVFHGGCRLDHAEAIVGGDGLDGTDVLDAMEHLVDAGLLNVTRSGVTVRYLQLEPIRQHGERMLDPAQRAALASRHGLVFARLAEEIGQGLRGSDFALWVEVPEADMANLRAAQSWAPRNGRPDVAVAIVAGLREYLNERLTTEVCDWGDAAVVLTRGRGDALEAEALAAAATGWMFQRRYEEIYAASARMSEMPGADADSLALVAWADGWARVNSGDHAAAPPVWQAALHAQPSAWYERSCAPAWPSVARSHPCSRRSSTGWHPRAFGSGTRSGP